MEAILIEREQPTMNIQGTSNLILPSQRGRNRKPESKRKIRLGKNESAHRYAT